MLVGRGTLSGVGSHDPFCLRDTRYGAI